MHLCDDGQDGRQQDAGHQEGGYCRAPVLVDQVAQRPGQAECADLRQEVGQEHHEVAALAQGVDDAAQGIPPRSPRCLLRQQRGILGVKGEDSAARTLLEVLLTEVVAADGRVMNPHLPPAPRRSDHDIVVGREVHDRSLPGRRESSPDLRRAPASGPQPQAVARGEGAQLRRGDALRLEGGGLPDQLPRLPVDAVRAERHGEAGQQAVALGLLKYCPHEVMPSGVMGSSGSSVGRGPAWTCRACRTPARPVISA